MTDYVNSYLLTSTIAANLITDVRVYPLLEKKGKLVNITCAMVTKFQQLFLLGSLKGTQNEELSKFSDTPFDTHHLTLIIDDDIIDVHKDDVMLPKES